MVLCLPPPTFCLRSARATPLEYAVTKNASASPLECAVPKSLDLKSPEMNSYKKRGGPPSFPLAIFVCQSVFISVHLWLHLLPYQNSISSRVRLQSAPHIHGSRGMRVHNEYLTVQTKQKREFQNITPSVKFAMEKSGINAGFVLVSTLHSNAAVFVNDEEPGLLADLDAWLEKVAPHGDEYKHGAKVESNASAHLQSLLVHHQVLVPISDRRLELGAWHSVVYAEVDGLRPKRILIKVMGE